MRSILDCRRYAAHEIEKLTGGRCISGDGQAQICAVTTDSREVMPGDVFFALRGENFDGHDFIASAVSRGASCIVCEHSVRNVPDSSAAFIRVNDVTEALGALSHAYLAQMHVKVVAITGSVGKTTTKEYTASVLSQKFRVHKTAGNYNNQLGLPMTILATPHDCELLVLEMGMSDRGQIEYLSNIAMPDVAVITSIGTSHIEQLGTRENICRAKMEITSGLKRGGKLILCGDEPLLRRDEMLFYSPEYVGIKAEDCSLRAQNITYGDMGTSFEINTDGACERFSLPTLGEHNVYNALFAVSVGRYFGMSFRDIRTGLAGFKSEKMRQNIYDCCGITIIEDCYNASPESMCASLDVMCELSHEKSGARKLALLGDMRELGAMTRELHEKVGIHVAECGIDLLFTYGAAASNIASAAKRAGMPESAIFENPDITDPASSANAIASNIRPGDILLVKASRATRAEKVLALVLGEN